MTSTEQLVEAVTYASDNNIEWHEVFDSPQEAIKVLRKAMKETPDEGQIVCLLESRGIDMFEYHTIEYAYKQELNVMYDEVEENA